MAKPKTPIDPVEELRRQLSAPCEQALEACSKLVWSIEPDDQTAIGNRLAELATANPQLVEAFIRRHALMMSKDCVRLAVAGLPKSLRGDLLAHHERATSLRH